jgi:hygromycin-B 7''-O-kinase
VVKLFGRLFGGEASFLAERQANRLVAGEFGIPVPRLVDTGSLFENSTEWPWPYLIIPFVPSISIGEMYEDVSDDDLMLLAKDIGVILRKLHQLPLDETPPLAGNWQAYRGFLQEQFESCHSRHREWGTLPKHLLAQLDSYVLPPDQMIDEQATPFLIHGDMTADHILGRLEDNHWTTLALIDFGDARVANLTYELVALHLDLFRRNKRLLRTFLDSYGVSDAQRKLLPHQAMSVTLLHDFNVLDGFFASGSSASDISSLDELATLLWETD